MDDWTYCLNTLPRVSRTFALNIAVLKGDLHRSVLVAYLFCRTIDTVEDASKLDPAIKVKLLQDFSRLIEDAQYRETDLDEWVRDCSVVDGSVHDLDLLAQIKRVFNVFDTLPEKHRQHIVPSVSRMAVGMRHFQKKFSFSQITLLENLDELEEYCYFVAGAVGEMLCNLLLEELPALAENKRQIMRDTAVSFGLGLQMTNICKDIVVDRSRGWSYIPKSIITDKGVTVDEFHSGACTEKNMDILEGLLQKTAGHLNDALSFTLAIPRRKMSLRLFCIWPLWMAMETVAILHNNPSLMDSDAEVKISRKTVKRILRRTPWIAYSNFLLTSSFQMKLPHAAFQCLPRFNLDRLKERLNRILLDSDPSKTQTV